MILEYIEKALSPARYEIIEDKTPWYGEVPELAGVWVTGLTLDECRKNLVDVIEGWIIVRLRRGLPAPPIDNCTIDDLVRRKSSVGAKITPLSGTVKVGLLKAAIKKAGLREEEFTQWL
jgi:predicted RNase H-like HicB family nuclease